MAVHKFLLKSGKGLNAITALDLELITVDPSEELLTLNNRIRSFNDALSNRLNRNTLIISNSRLTIFNQTFNNNQVSYKLGYDTDDQDLEFRINSVQGVLNTIKHLYINSDSDNKINFTSGQPAIQIIVPSGKLPSITGKGKTVHAQTLRTPDFENLVYLTGDLDNDTTTSGSAISSDEYSLEEQITNKKWINGKSIYRKVFDFGTIPNSGGTYTLDHNLNIETYTSLQILVPSMGRTGMFNPEARDDSTSTTAQQFILFSSMDALTSGDYLILEYVKNT